VILGQVVVIILSGVLVAWLAGGIWYNRRRAHRVWRWLEPGLKVLGGRISGLSTSGTGAGLRASVRNTKAPFRRVQVVARLESRENLPLWLFEQLQGRGDQIAFRGWLRSSPHIEVEIVPTESELDRALRRQTESPWQRVEPSAGWVMAWRGELGAAQEAALRTLLVTYASHLRRFSLSRSEPHLFVQLSLAGLASEPSREWLERVKNAVPEV
jgi:hypothetical protein